MCRAQVPLVSRQPADAEKRRRAAFLCAASSLVSTFFPIFIMSVAQKKEKPLSSLRTETPCRDDLVGEEPAVGDLRGRAVSSKQISGKDGGPPKVAGGLLARGDREERSALAAANRNFPSPLALCLPLAFARCRFCAGEGRSTGKGALSVGRSEGAFDIR